MNEPAFPAPAANGTIALADAARLRLLDPKRVRFFKAGATLRMTLEDESCWLAVVVLRVFPLSDPQRYLSVRDGGAAEIGIVADPAGLDPESRRLVEDELSRRYMVSLVRKVVSVEERFGTVDWIVETQRGRRSFTTRDLRDNVLRPGPGHYLLTDVENNRYEIPNLNDLDAQSQSWLLRHL